MTFFRTTINIKSKDPDVSFSDVAEDSVECFLMSLANTPEFQQWWGDIQKDPKLVAVMNSCLEQVKSEVILDMSGFKIVEG